MSNKISIFSVKAFCFSLLMVLLALSPSRALAYEPNDEKVVSERTEEIKTDDEVTNDEDAEKFNAGEMINEHIGDAHQWHLWGDHGHAAHLPLPVILWTDKGLEVFSSSRLEDSKDAYQGNHYRYMLKHEHIEVVDDFGNVNEEATAKILDFSITKNVATIMVSSLLMLLIFLSVAKSYKKREGQAPKGLQSFMEPLIIFVRDDIAKGSIGEKKYQKYLPYLLTLFFFIFLNNLLGLIPLPFYGFGANLTGNISICITLAVLTLVITLVSANGHYWRHIFAMPGVPIPVLIILTPIEILGVVLRPFVLMIRLFANITAGHIIALSFYSLIFIFGAKNIYVGYGVSVVSILFTVFMGFLELLVAFLQAYVFTLLTAIYIGAAVEEGHHELDHHAEPGHETVHIVA